MRGQAGQRGGPRRPPETALELPSLLERSVIRASKVCLACCSTARDGRLANRLQGLAEPRFSGRQWRSSTALATYMWAIFPDDPYPHVRPRPSGPQPEPGRPDLHGTAGIPLHAYVTEKEEEGRIPGQANGNGRVRDDPLHEQGTRVGHSTSAAAQMAAVTHPA